MGAAVQKKNAFFDDDVKCNGGVHTHIHERRCMRDWPTKQLSVSPAVHTCVCDMHTPYLFTFWADLGSSFPLRCRLGVVCTTIPGRFRSCKRFFMFVFFFLSHRVQRWRGKGVIASWPSPEAFSLVCFFFLNVFRTWPRPAVMAIWANIVGWATE